MYWKIYCVNLPGSIDWELDSMDRSLCRFFFYRIFNSAQAHMMCWVLCFALSIEGKTLATFWCYCLCCMCESLVKSRGVCLHTYLGLSRSRLTSRAWWSLQLLHKELKENTSGSTCGCCESKTEIICGLKAVTWLW